MCANAPQLPGGGGGWAQLELTDALCQEIPLFLILIKAKKDNGSQREQQILIRLILC